MASGKVHDKIAYKTSPLVFMIIYVFSKDLFLSLFSMFVYILGSLMFCSDLDIPSNETKRWGVFKFIWTPYQKTFKHRSFATHSVVCANIIRLIYLSLWIYIPMAILSFLLGGEIYSIPLYYSQIYNFIINNTKISFIFFLSLCFASLSHLIADLTSTNIKKIKRKLNIKSNNKNRNYKKNNNKKKK